MLPGSSALGEGNILGLDPCSLGVAPQNQSDIFPRLLIPLFGRSFFAPNPRLAKSKDALEKICPIWRLSSLLCLLPAWRKLGEEVFLSQRITIIFSSNRWKFSQYNFFIPANPKISGVCLLTQFCLQTSQVFFPEPISYSTFSNAISNNTLTHTHCALKLAYSLFIIPTLSGSFSTF